MTGSSSRIGCANTAVFVWLPAAFLQPCRQINGLVVGGGCEPITETTFKRMRERIGKRIDLCGATPHVFRHTNRKNQGSNKRYCDAICDHWSDALKKKQ